jgi:Putative DNA-binding domain
MPYNPFEKPIGEALQPEDLQILITRQVAEGYYVEYKRELPTQRHKIARSLASLANTYGGWYIVGVETDGHNVAKTVLGFAPELSHDPISVIRDLIKHHIDPVPVLFPHVITLDTGNLVLIVYVPDKQETPFITSDGRIYRRTHDSSDPVPETSRYALDQIVERGKEVSKNFARFSKDERTLIKEKENGWLKIYISPYPFGLIEPPDIFSTSAIKKLLAASKKSIKFPLDGSENTISGNIEFNAIYPTANSLILRQTNFQSEAFNSLTVEFDIFGRAKIFIPLPQGQMKGSALHSLCSPLVKQQISARLKADDAGYNMQNLLKFFDIGKLWLTTSILSNYYLEWLGELTTITGFQVALEFDNMWRCVPFYDFDSWGKQVQQFGLPVLMRDYVRFPEEEGKGRIFSAENGLWIELCLFIGLACGLPSEFFARSIGEIIMDTSRVGKSFS